MTDVADPREAEAAQRLALPRARADGLRRSVDLDDPLAHPRSSAEPSCRAAPPPAPAAAARASAAIVARTMLCGLFEPMHLVSTLAMPGQLDDRAHAAAGDDAGAVGRRLEQHLAGAEATVTSYGMVPSTSGTSTMLFFAFSMPLRIASGTSFALPRPKPTRPLLSPTTTSALKLKRRPPFTTLATRLMWTTFSLSSVPAVVDDPSRALPICAIVRHVRRPQNSRPPSRAPSATARTRP